MFKFYFCISFSSLSFLNFYSLLSSKPSINSGSCWSFSSITALEGHLAEETGDLEVLSTEELITCVNNPSECGGTGGCEGATAELAYAYIAKHGILKEESFPYTAKDDQACPLKKDDEEDYQSFITTLLRHSKNSTSSNKNNNKERDVVAKIKGYAKIPPNSYKGLMNAIAKHSPVVVAAAASSWMFYSGGVYSPTDKTDPDVWDLNHGIVVEGYGECYYLLTLG
jgi:cathepsin L